METEDIIRAIEDKMEIVKNSTNRKYTFRVIKEKDWQKIRKRFLPRDGFDEADRLVEVLDD